MKKMTVHLKGKPSAVRWVTAAVVVWPVMIVRYALIVVLVAWWVWNAPRAAVLTWNKFAAVESPNKKRTPKESRTLQRFDDFDDVRVRVSELTQ